MSAGDKVGTHAGDKVAVVTGAARGIGLAIARRFLAGGYRVAAIDNDADTLMRSVPELGAPDRILPVVCDVAFADQVATAVLQGPSRAALQASDVSTMQGQTELNRLLRGDDAARNQDLVELQRQNNELTKQLVDLQRNAGVPPVLDL